LILRQQEINGLKARSSLRDLIRKLQEHFWMILLILKKMN